jgi:hypothetical protein
MGPSIGERVEKREYQPHEQRVIEERKELDAKIDKLYRFLEYDALGRVPSEELARLRLQYQAMRMYSTILGQRIAAF